MRPTRSVWLKTPSTLKRSARRFDKLKASGRVEKLPGGPPSLSGWGRCVRSLRTQQRAQCQMPKTRAVFGSFGFLWNILTKQKQVSNDLFLLVSNSRGCDLFRSGSASNVPFISVGVRLNIYGEFDPGSGRTLAACLTHASRTVNKELASWDQWRTGE